MLVNNKKPIEELEEPIESLNATVENIKNHVSQKTLSSDSIEAKKDKLLVEYLDFELDYFLKLKDLFKYFFLPVLVKTEDGNFELNSLGEESLHSVTGGNHLPRNLMFLLYSVSNITKQCSAYFADSETVSFQKMLTFWNREICKTYFDSKIYSKLNKILTVWINSSNKNASFKKYIEDVSKENSLEGDFFIEALKTIIAHMPKYSYFIEKAKKVLRQGQELTDGEPNQNECLLLKKCEETLNKWLEELEQTTDKRIRKSQRLSTYYSSGMRNLAADQIVHTFFAEKWKIVNFKISSKVVSKGLRKYILTKSKLIEFQKQKEKSFLKIFSYFVGSKEYALNADVGVSEVLPDFIHNINEVREDVTVYLEGEDFRFILALDSSSDKEDFLVKFNSLEF